MADESEKGRGTPGTTGTRAEDVRETGLERAGGGNVSHEGTDGADVGEGGGARGQVGDKDVGGPGGGRATGREPGREEGR